MEFRSWRLGLLALGWVAGCSVIFSAPASSAETLDTWAELGPGCTSPINETCENAIVFSTGDLPFMANEPLACVNDVIDKPYFDSFYRYDCTQTGTHIIHMCDSSGDTYLRVYEDGCGWGDGVELATADDECPGSPPNADPFLAIELQAGQSYWIEVGTWRPEPPWAPPPNSPYTLSVTLEGQAPRISCDGTRLATFLVAEPGNSADTNGLGSVAELFRMGRLEVTNRQWVDLLSAVAAADPNGLYNEEMTDSGRGGILRNGSAGSYSYFVKESFGDKPVNFLSWLDAARYANWLHNGEPTGPQGPMTTEAGAYDLADFPEDVIRQPEATFFLPTHDEWYKAAYFDPFDPGADSGGSLDYWLYPTSSDAVPVQAGATTNGDVSNPGTNVANYGSGADWNGENGNVTSTGSATSSSPWGLLDMAGNLLELTETLDTPISPDLPTRTSRGGDFANASILMSSAKGFALALNMAAEAGNVGFRLAAKVCLGDFDGDNDVDEGDRDLFAACFTGDGGGPISPVCGLGDFDGDMDVDCQDWSLFEAAWTSLEEPLPLPGCDSSIFSDGFESGDTSAWSLTVGS